MAGVELTDKGLIIRRNTNVLDDLAIEFSSILTTLDIDHAFVAGYVAILAGRARSTEAIDVVIERLSSERLDTVVARLSEADFWGPAMPLGSIETVLDQGDHAWVARSQQLTPRLDLSYPTTKYDRATLANAIPAMFDDQSIPIGPLELQIAYKLALGSRTDLEDAAHLYLYFEESLSIDRLEYWVDHLAVADHYERLIDE